MTRKHFQMIAAVIKDFDFGSDEQRLAFAKAMASDVCEPLNGNFDTDRFLAACRRED
tara:strand:- start:723 stop:893 length:171 start_codon:yes stop_codon:yes gene_type:complete